jgi:hypothetical protein
LLPIRNAWEKTRKNGGNGGLSTTDFACKEPSERSYWLCDNPDKTTSAGIWTMTLQRFLELHRKRQQTDRRMYVTGINSLTEKAKEHMIATNIVTVSSAAMCLPRFQSFRNASYTRRSTSIGLKPARAMWGLNIRLFLPPPEHGNIHDQ